MKKMGSKQARLRSFLARHPVCCYCGGKSASSTEDHWPSRSIFDQRKWPEGFVFPACATCNAATAEDETIFALLCRLGMPPILDESTEQTLKLLKAVEERLPDVFQTLQNQRPVPNGPLHKFGLPPLQSEKSIAPYAISIDHPDIHHRMARCIAKLLFSLHYRHTETVVPSKGGAVWEWLTNGSKENEALFDSAMASFAFKRTEIKWQKVNLHSQFYYEYGAFCSLSSGHVSVFRISLHNTVSICGIIFDDLDYLADELPADRLARPFTSAVS